MLEKDIKKVIDGVYPFHMPGHKRQKQWLEGLYDLDITEIPLADDLHAPKGIIMEAQRRVCRKLGTVGTIFLTGGSTCGILSAISAVCENGDGIVVARNCHKSVYNACEIKGLTPEYVYPALKPRLGCFGEIQASAVAEALEKSGARAVVITSPTYEGIVSDIKTIAKVVHKYKAILIVDSAHGAHFGLCDYFPESARDLGADIVVESAHKTMPCLTGAALLHICSHRVSYSAIQEALAVFETSSPPYPILCSIDRAYKATENQKLFLEYGNRLDRFYEKTKKLRRLSIYETADRGKLVICCGDSDITGFELKRRLREQYLIECEMAMPAYCLAMTSVADTDEGFDRLSSALLEIDATLKSGSRAMPPSPPKTEKAKTKKGDFEPISLPLNKCVGKISDEYVFAYPPGNPIITPGEVFSEEIIEYILHLSSTGAQVYSSKGDFPDFLWILKEKD